jgi:hypothetical protein
VVEIKRPAHTTTYDDAAQLLGYANMLQQQFPQTEVFQCFLIGKQFDATLASREPLTQGNLTVIRRSFAEIVEGARRRYEEILSIFAKEERA